MSTIVTRSGKGSPLTHNEVDANFNNLNTTKVENTEPVRHSVRPSLLLDFANTKTLDPRITFTRASTGTFYDGKTVAKAEENLLTYSQVIGGAQWTNDGNGATVTATINSAQAPDGTTTATTLVYTNVTANPNRAFTSKSFANSLGQTYIGSVYLKGAVGGEEIYVTCTDFGTQAVATRVTLTTSWQRFSVSITIASSGRNYFLYVGNDLRYGGTTATSAQTIFAWGAQLENRTTVTAYTPTTTAPITNYVPVLLSAPANVARFDHNPVTGESLGLEVEEQRTNLATYSDDFSNAAWTKNLSTITPNTIVAPDGTLTGDKLVEDTSTGLHGVALSTPGIASAFSIYVKAAERTRVQLRIFGAGNITVLDLTNGSTVSGNGTAVPVGNGWYRCTLVVSAPTFSVLSINTISSGTTDSYTGDGYSGVYIWGAQLEAASFATSYIPTVASQVTRSADSASMTGTNFSSWYRADEGSFYYDFAGINPSNSYVILSAVSNSTDSGANIEAWRLRVDSANRISLRAFTATEQCTISSADNLYVRNQIYKIAGALQVNNFALSINGALTGTDTSGQMPTQINKLSLLSGRDAGATSGYIRKFSYYPKCLTNAELQGLTTV